MKQGMLMPGYDPLEQEADVEIINVSEYELKRIPTKTWRDYINACHSEETETIMSQLNRISNNLSKE